MWAFGVLSPPCGMETFWFLLAPLKWNLWVLSPPCGMETLKNVIRHTFHRLNRFWAHRVGWRQSFNSSNILSTHFVLSPPCGMETAKYFFRGNSSTGSEPTVWDGDKRKITKLNFVENCSEPTVWDGDFVKKPLSCCFSPVSSEPTVWDSNGHSYFLQLWNSPICSYCTAWSWKIDKVLFFVG